MPKDTSRCRMTLWNRLWVQYHIGYAFSRMEHSLIFADEVRNSSESSFRTIGYAQGTKEQSPRSPDLTRLDLFFWSHLRNTPAYAPLTIFDAASINTPPRTAERMRCGVQHRINLCKKLERHQFEHLFRYCSSLLTPDLRNISLRFI
jgi:hypothetical protein